MADYAPISTQGNGSTTEYTITFSDYLKQSNVTVQVDGVTLTNGVDYTINDTTKKVVFTTAPANGASISITRVTPTDLALNEVDFSSGGGFDESDMNDVIRQSLLIDQENKYADTELSNRVAALESDTGSSSNLVFDTVASLTANTVAITTGTKIAVKGYYDKEDGGFGPNLIKTADTSSTGNGFTIFVDAIGQRFKRTLKGSINGLWAGMRPITGSSVTDNSSAVTTIANYFESSDAWDGGKDTTIVVPAGIYAITATDISTARSLIFQGESSGSVPIGGTVFCPYSAAQDYLIQLTPLVGQPLVGAAFRDIGFTGRIFSSETGTPPDNYATFSRALLVVDRNNNVIHENLLFQHADEDTPALEIKSCYNTRFDGKTYFGKVGSWTRGMVRLTNDGSTINSNIFFTHFWAIITRGSLMVQENKDTFAAVVWDRITQESAEGVLYAPYAGTHTVEVPYFDLGFGTFRVGSVVDFVNSGRYDVTSDGIVYSFKSGFKITTTSTEGVFYAPVVNWAQVGPVTPFIVNTNSSWGVVDHHIIESTIGWQAAGYIPSASDFHSDISSKSSWNLPELEMRGETSNYSVRQRVPFNESFNPASYFTYDVSDATVYCGKDTLVAGPVQQALYSTDNNEIIRIEAGMLPDLSVTGLSLEAELRALTGFSTQVQLILTYDDASTATKTFATATASTTYEVQTVYAGVADLYPTGKSLEQISVKLLGDGAICRMLLSPNKTGSSELSGVRSGSVILQRHNGTAQTGTATTITLAAGASAVDDFYNGWTVLLTGGTGSGDIQTITDYNGTTKIATVASWGGSSPDATTTYTLGEVATILTKVASASSNGGGLVMFTSANFGGGLVASYAATVSLIANAGGSSNTKGTNNLMNFYAGTSQGAIVVENLTSSTRTLSWVLLSNES